MAVAQLYYHCAPRTEVPVVVKALIRLLRAHSEVQAVVLTCIAAMSTERKVFSLQVYIPFSEFCTQQLTFSYEYEFFLLQFFFFFL